MANPRKALITVLVGQGEDKLLIPFPVEKTANDLVREVQRRLGVEVDLSMLSTVRVRGADGPRVFGEDQLEDLIGESSVFFVGPAQPIALSPKYGEALSPESQRTCTPRSSMTSGTTLASLLSPPVPVTPMGDETPIQNVLKGPGDLPPPPELPPTDAAESLLAKYQSAKEKEADRTHVLGKLKYKPLRAATPPRLDDEAPKPEAPEEEEAPPTALKRTSDSDDSQWYFNPPLRAAKPGDASVRPRTRRGDGPSSKGDDMGGDAALAKPSSVAGASIEVISERRVDWVITGIQAKLQEYPKGTRLFSPEFSAHGVNHLGLVLYPNGNSNAKLGFCSLGLKAPHGAHLRYKLIVGGTEKFTELRQNVTESWGFVDMCKVEEAVSRGDDSLRLGVEIIDDIDKNEELVQVGSHKIEWVLHNMANKLEYYHKDVALYSEEFSAAGVDKLRMKLYLHGKSEADDGWCSLYLEAPKGSELRCRLSVGKKGMSFDRLEKFGEDSIWGFLTLCQIADEVEGDDLRVGLQVLETKRLDANLTEVEDQYLKTLPAERRAFLLDELQRVEKIRNQADQGGVPSRFRILMMQLPDSAKAVALQRLESLSTDLMGAEATKLKRWVDGVLALPFGKLERPLVSLGEGQDAVRKYLARAVRMLDESVYGHDEPKERITQVLCQWISNPDSMSLVLGIQGPPGNGKTTLCRKGVAEALGRPFAQLSLGGATDASVLEGHSYTYVGSSWGRVAGLLMETQCMNPVVFFDELDKVSETPRGEEINGVLTHLTDHSQNTQFTDRYFDGIPIDLSKAMFIFSFNDESKIHPVLRDRLTIVKTKGFNREQKQHIARHYLLPELLRNVGMEETDVVLQEGKQGVADVSYLLEKWGVRNEPALSGVRPLKQALEAVVLHVNKLRVLQGHGCGQKQTNEAAATAEAPESNGKAVSDRSPSVAKAGNGSAEAPPPPPAAEEKAEASDPSASIKGNERKATASTLTISLPLTLTRELIDQLLPQREGDKLPEYMYV